MLISLSSVISLLISRFNTILLIELVLQILIIIWRSKKGSWSFAVNGPVEYIAKDLSSLNTSPGLPFSAFHSVMRLTVVYFCLFILVPQTSMWLAFVSFSFLRHVVRSLKIYFRTEMLGWIRNKIRCPNCSTCT